MTEIDLAAWQQQLNSHIIKQRQTCERMQTNAFRVQRHAEQRCQEVSAQLHWLEASLALLQERPTLADMEVSYFDLVKMSDTEL